MSNRDKSDDRLISFSERTIAKSLLDILQSVSIGDEIHHSPEFQKVLQELEGFIPEVLEEVDHYWSEICCDGILPICAYKIGERAIKIFGNFFMLPPRDPSMYLCMQVDPAGETINWFECKLGLEAHHGGNSQYRNRRERMNEIYSPDGHENSTNWTHMVTYGTRDE